MSSEKLRVVVETAGFVCKPLAAARDQSPAAACLRLAENRYIRLFIYKDILREVQNVLSHDYVRASFRHSPTKPSAQN